MNIILLFVLLAAIFGAVLAVGYILNKIKNPFG